jgi:hypothetical protein
MVSIPDIKETVDELERLSMLDELSDLKSHIENAISRLNDVMDRKEDAAREEKKAEIRKSLHGLVECINAQHEPDVCMVNAAVRLALFDSPEIPVNRLVLPGGKMTEWAAKLGQEAIIHGIIVVRKILLLLPPRQVAWAWKKSIYYDESDQEVSFLMYLRGMFKVCARHGYCKLRDPKSIPGLFNE